MKTENHSRQFGRGICGALAIAILSTLTGCPKHPPPPAAATAPPMIVEQPPVVMPADFIYYPDYEVYYDPVGRVYWCNDGGRWVSSPAPIGISVDVLLGSPSARVDFHDSPANHHAEVVRQYPRGWRPDDRSHRGH